MCGQFVWVNEEQESVKSILFTSRLLEKGNLEESRDGAWGGPVAPVVIQTLLGQENDSRGPEDGGDFALRDVQDAGEVKDNQLG